MAEEKNTQFNYLLNAMERASQEKSPAQAGYGSKRKALIAHVRELERKAAAYDALLAAGVPAHCACPPSECHGEGIQRCRWCVMEANGWTRPDAAGVTPTRGGER